MYSLKLHRKRVLILRKRYSYGRQIYKADCNLISTICVLVYVYI